MTVPTKIIKLNLICTFKVVLIVSRTLTGKKFKHIRTLTEDYMQVPPETGKPEK